jgi:hypothetical protein
MSKSPRRSPVLVAAAVAFATPAHADPTPLNVPTNAAEAAPAPAVAGPPNPVPRDLTLNVPPAPPPAPPPPAPPPPAPPPAAPPPRPPPPPRQSPAPSATVTVGLREEFTRLAFRFSGPTTVTPVQEGARLDLRFSRAADLDAAELIASPPRFVRAVRRLSAAGQAVRLQLTLDPGVRQRHFVDGDRVIIDLLPPSAAPAEAPDTSFAQNGATAAAQAPAPTVRGTGRVQLVEEAQVTRVSVQWPAPARAAAFRRGEAVWLLFEASGQIDLSGVARAGRRHQDIEIVRGEGVIGLRIPVSPEVLVSANADGATWSFALGASADESESAPVRREVDSEGRGRLIAAFGRDGVVRWIADPSIGDRIAVALLDAPVKGVDVRRATLEASILPAAQGAVIEPRADGVAAAFQGGQLVVTRGEGLIAAESGSEMSAATLEAALEHAGAGPPSPGAGAQVRQRLDHLMRRAADEGVREGAAVTARLELARFLLQQELAPEALGALRIAAINQGELVELDPEFRLMRGAANVMMGRVKAAEADLNASALAEDPSAALWRGYAAAQVQDWAEARRQLERGVGALEQHPPGWRARFQLALAEAAFESNDYAAAEAAARAAMGQAPDQALRLHARFIEARLVAARGDHARALVMLDELSGARDEEIAVRATLEAVKLRRADGVMGAADSVEILEPLRYRWRGDATELSIIGALGEAYAEQGRWREAMTAMRGAADRFARQPAARRLREDLATLFERLFLDGEADKLEPIQALGLFYEFSELTPVGPNGDRIVRLLAGRLVHVDLLEQAAQLLQHQVDERLDGIGKAQVAADLAAVYLMDNKPERALIAINSSRQPNLPTTLLAERRILEARALLGLGRLDHAAELVERDQSEDAQRVRADAAWRARDWERAAAELHRLTAARDRSQPLDQGGRQAVLREAIALTLAGDDAAVRALYRERAGDMAGTPEADDFEVVASGVHAEGVAIRDLARVVARTDLLDRFMQRIRARITAEAAAAPPPPPPPPGAPAPEAPAALPAGQQQRQTPARPSA